MTVGKVDDAQPAVTEGNAVVLSVAAYVVAFHVGAAVYYPVSHFADDFVSVYYISGKAYNTAHIAWFLS